CSAMTALVRSPCRYCPFRSPGGPLPLKPPCNRQRSENRQCTKRRCWPAHLNRAAAQPLDQIGPTRPVVTHRRALLLGQHDDVQTILGDINSAKREHLRIPSLLMRGSRPGNCSGMEEATGAPSSLTDWGPKRLRASRRDRG